MPKIKDLSDYTDVNESVGHKVISIEHGLGEIRSVEILQEGGDPFFVVEFSDTKTKNFFPVKKNINLRMICSQDKLESILDTIKTVKDFEELKSKKDKLAYFKRPLVKNNLDSIANRVCELSAVKDVSVNEQNILDKLIKTVVLETSIILSKSLKESNEIITKLLKEQNDSN